VGRTESTIRLRLLRSGVASAAQRQALQAEEIALARVSSPVPLSAHPSAEEVETALQQTELGEATADSLLAELSRTEAGARAALGETALYLKLKALVYLPPECCGRLGKRLGDAPARGAAMRVLPQALAGSGRRQAQAALAEGVRARRHDWPALAEMLP